MTEDNNDEPDIDLTGPTDANWMAAGRKRRRFKENRRDYWNERHDVFEVGQDNRGPMDLVVVFNEKTNRENKVLLVLSEVDGSLRSTDRARLGQLLSHKPDGIEIRIEFLRDTDKSLDHDNTTYTTIMTLSDFNQHVEKLERLRSEE